ncbi:rod-binding protein [Brevundimonas sp. SORGH_AS_0993]|uniref:rod-binding protein n=1 Tax=Brevundimonas sp. SORGH_AS_0993 TaxID=3041794 RepID=UPI0027882119|nr:rod-binding protein [Brevundimonas sp. SORGH_AS_0993]MDQ1153376.1 flagellar protein FlgJ [Brevundimonas sp. SORGH_AS_0993]
MTDLTASPDLLRPAPGLGVPAPGASNQKLKETADAFEASFLSQMLKPMFEGLSTDGLFGGGQAEGTWRSFLLDEIAKKTVASGGIGLSSRVMTEMLKMQEKGQ